MHKHNRHVTFSRMYTRMGSNAKRILIETESHSVFLLHRKPGDLHIAFCVECGGDNEMLTLDGAVELSGRRGRELTRLVETGEIHSNETANGYLLICLRSLETLVDADSHLIGEKRVDEAG